MVFDGVRQGGVLAPCLFNLYVNDLSSRLEFHNVLFYGTGEINRIMCADDIVLIVVNNMHCFTTIHQKHVFPSSLAPGLGLI